MNKKNKIPKAQNPESMTDQFMALYEVIKILRKDCPWDSKQTNESIAYLSIEEVYEMVDAVEKKDDNEFATELGDVLLHIIMHSIMAEERGAFNMIDVFVKIQNKLVSRHPHVFDGLEVDGEEDVVRNWEQLKKKEGQKSALQGVPRALPALLRAERIQHKASKVGFDWDNKLDVWAKVEEELGELKEEIQNRNKDRITDELGDLIFAIVNAARFEEIMPEEALQRTNNKFTSRFNYIEKKVAEQGRDLRDLTLGEMDEIWEEAKSLEKK